MQKISAGVAPNSAHELSEVWPHRFYTKRKERNLAPQGALKHNKAQERGVSISVAYNLLIVPRQESDGCVDGKSIYPPHVTPENRSLFPETTQSREMGAYAFPAEDRAPFLFTPIKSLSVPSSPRRSSRRRESNQLEYLVMMLFSVFTGRITASVFCASGWK